MGCRCTLRDENQKAGTSAGPLPGLSGHPGWAVDDADVAGIHAGAVGGFEAFVGVFKDDAACRRDVHEACGFEEDVGLGLAVGDVRGDDDVVEQRQQMSSAEGCFDVGALAVRSDRHGDASLPGAGDLGDDGDLLEQMETVLKGDPIVVEDGLPGDGCADDLALEVVEEGARCEAGAGIVEGVGHLEVIVLEAGAESAEVGGRGVDEGAVAVEDKGVEGTFAEIGDG